MLCTKWLNLVSLLVVFAMLLGVCPPVLAQESPPAPGPQGLRPDAPEYAVHGPYAVGTREFMVEAGDRTMPITVWYPALNPEDKPEEIIYSMDISDQGLPEFPVLGNAILDAPADMSGAPYPLVIWSHGAYLYRQTNAYLTEHLASQGFVVVAGNHDDNWGTFPASNAASYVSRPADISAWIDFAEEQTASGGDLAGLIDTEHIAAGGHSFGGYTALAAAGARFNPAWYLDVVCANNTLAEDDPLNDCSALVRELPEMATLSGLDAVPEGLWPNWQDPRVDAIFLLAPSSAFGEDGAATVTIPVMSLTGSADPMQDPALHVYLTHKHLGSADKSLVVFQDGGHTMFLNDCTSATGMADVAYEWCSDAVWDTDRVHDLTNHFATAFLLSELKGDADAAATLAPENVAFPGIEYETTGYGVAPEAALDEATVAKIEAMVEKMMADTGTPGYALGIVKDGQIVYTKGFGVERVGEDTPVTEHTVFGTGCVGKTTVATALMQLVDADKIDLDAPVTNYLPYFKLADERYKGITIRQLITHRSGLPEIEDWISSPVEYDDGVLERYVRSLDNTKLLFAPGERWSYTSIGYTVLADVIQKVTGQTFEDYLQQHILDPLGMENTLLIVGEADQAHVAGNHVHDNAGEVVVSDIFPYRRQFAAGGPLYSSISDLARYALAHLNRGELDGQRILPAADYDAMWEPISAMNVPLFPALQAHYGMGWFVGALDGHRAVGHFGADEGYAALMLLAPDDNAGLVLASDFFDWDEFDISGWETGIDIMKMLLAEGE